MHCDICGSRVPAGREVCDTCGSWVERSVGSEAPLPVPASDNDGPPAKARICSCPRCRYEGQGLSYFTRGPHMFGLIGATLLTMPFALGAGGVVYFLLRYDHQICPRCGEGWGKYGERAVRRGSSEELPTIAPAATVPVPGGGSVKRTWSIMLFALGLLLLTAGVLQANLFATVVGILSSAGGVVLHRQARVEREQRRSALLANLQTPVLQLAAQRGGKLTVTEVAASLRWPIRRAEKVLHSLDDGWRVSSDITDEGVIVYEFRELLLGPGGSTSG